MRVVNPFKVGFSLAPRRLLGLFVPLQTTDGKIVLIVYCLPLNSS